VAKASNRPLEQLDRRLVPLAGPSGNITLMKAADRLAVRLGAIISAVLAVWGLAFVATPFGAIGGSGAAAFGLVFGVLALRSDAWGGGGRWPLQALRSAASCYWASPPWSSTSRSSSRQQLVEGGWLRSGTPFIDCGANRLDP
jgi:hypothetical protein